MNIFYGFEKDTYSIRYLDIDRTFVAIWRSVMNHIFRSACAFIVVHMRLNSRCVDLQWGLVKVKNKYLNIFHHKNIIHLLAEMLVPYEKVLQYHWCVRSSFRRLTFVCLLNTAKKNTIQRH